MNSQVIASITNEIATDNRAIYDEEDDDEEKAEEEKPTGAEPGIPRDPLINPFWIESSALGTGPLGKLFYVRNLRLSEIAHSLIFIVLTCRKTDRKRKAVLPGFDTALPVADNERPGKGRERCSGSAGPS